ncbi:hypothetical protein AB4072_01910 [Microvirga sp. 2MCAF38]|uniref:hypothetical protein n=1 Tax=Microvirga sp. 2MCAF38 TaxID=3232989 RepID=UPI003F9C8B03
MLLATAACAPARPQVDLFDTGNLNDQQWERVQNECDYEASKAVAAADPGPVRHYDWKKLYFRCLDLKGVKYLGTADDFPEWKKK